MTMYPPQSGLFQHAARSTLLGQTPPPVYQWAYVTRRFTRLASNLALTTDQLADGLTKHGGVRATLNRAYYGHSSETANSYLIGSWGKDTRVRPSRDIDLVFLLPASVYERYQQRTGNRQSALLQEVKDVLAKTYTQTTMRGDGQVVIVPFNTIPIEVCPGFRCNDGSVIICDSNDGGRYKVSSAEAEIIEIEASDSRRSQNTRKLVRLVKCWQRENNAWTLKSFQLERLAIQFLEQWEYCHNDEFYHDWMVRDFFAFLTTQANRWIVMPGNGEVVGLGDDWLSRAQSAHKRAIDACEYERDNYEALAGVEWQRIFGAAVPVTMS